MAILFDCGWEDGSGILNTGGASVWSSSNDAGSRLSVVSTPTLWGDHSLRLGTYMGAAAYVVGDIAAGTYGVRMGFYIDASSLSAGNIQDLLWGFDGSSFTLFSVSLLHDGSQLNLTVSVYDTSSTPRNLGYVPVSLDTRYQMLLRIQKNVSGGASFKVLDGSESLVGTEKTLGAYTTKNSSLASVILGNQASTGYTITLGFDAIQFTDTYAYPSPATDSVSGSYTMPAVSSRPGTAVPALSGVRKGIPSMPGVSARPVVATPLLFTYPAGQLLICDWEAGSDEKNTGGAGVWDAINDAGNSLQLLSSPAIWGTYSLAMTAPASRADVTKAIGSTGKLGIRVHILNHGGLPGVGAIQPLFTLLDGSSNTLLKVSAVQMDPDVYFVVTAFDTGGIERTVSGIAAVDTYQILIKWKKGTAGGASVRFMHKDGSTVLSEGTLPSSYTTRNTDATLMSLGSLAGTGFAYEADFDEFQAVSSYEYPEPSSLTPSRTIYTPQVAVAPAVAVPTVTGIQYTTITMAGTTATPIVAVPVMTSDINGGYAMPGVTVPAWSAVPVLTGVVILVGAYTMPALIVHPVVVAATVHGIRYFRLWLRKVE